MLRLARYALGLWAIGVLAMSADSATAQYNYYHASTAAEGYARGMADVVRSAGARNLLNSQAAQGFADARRMEYENRLINTKTYFEQRQMNAAYREKERIPPLSSEAAARWAAAGAPARLTANQLDPVTGAVSWPLILTQSRYDADRERLDALFAERASSGGHYNGDVYMSILGACDSLRTALNSNLNEYRSDDFLRASRFLDSLAYEARFAGL